MERDKEETKVIFKKNYDRYLKEWFVVAFFPEVTVNRGNIMSYVHDGQHGEASYDYYLSCRPASKKEYAPLKKELEGLFGYRLKIVHKVTRKDQEYAWRFGERMDRIASRDRRQGQRPLGRVHVLRGLQGVKVC